MSTIRYKSPHCSQDNSIIVQREQDVIIKSVFKAAAAEHFWKARLHIIYTADHHVWRRVPGVMQATRNIIFSFRTRQGQSLANVNQLLTCQGYTMSVTTKATGYDGALGVRLKYKRESPIMLCSAYKILYSQNVSASKRQSPNVMNIGSLYSEHARDTNG